MNAQQVELLEHACTAGQLVLLDLNSYASTASGRDHVIGLIQEVVQTDHVSWLSLQAYDPDRFILIPGHTVVGFEAITEVRLYLEAVPV